VIVSSYEDWKYTSKTTIWKLNSWSKRESTLGTAEGSPVGMRDEGMSKERDDGEEKGTRLAEISIL
jgi:hypothetical protein